MNNLNLENMTPDEINDYLETINLIPSELMDQIAKEKHEKILVNKMKQREHVRKYAEINREVIRARRNERVKELYKNSAEYRYKQKVNHSRIYYMKKIWYEP